MLLIKKFTEKDTRVIFNTILAYSAPILADKKFYEKLEKSRNQPFEKSM